LTTPFTTFIKSGFTMVPNRILLDSALSAKAVRLAEVLEHHSGGNRTCWPGYVALAKEVGCSVKWLPTLIDKLVEAGYLHVQFRLGKTNIYTLLLRVERPQKPTQEVKPGLPMQSAEYEQKQPTKTKEDRAYRPLKEGIDFSKWLPGGVNEKFTRPLGA
jgi:hypothetical protein